MKVNPRAARYLRAKLANGPVPVISIYADGAEFGFSGKLLRRTATALGVEKIKTGWQGQYVWGFPDENEFQDVGSND